MVLKRKGERGEIFVAFEVLQIYMVLKRQYKFDVRRSTFEVLQIYMVLKRGKYGINQGNVLWRSTNLHGSQTMKEFNCFKLFLWRSTNLHGSQTIQIVL